MLAPMTIDVALNPAEIALLPQADLSATTCVVFDILRATSSMITGLAHGVVEIIPVATIEEARAARRNQPHALLGGERRGEKIDGFDLGNSPFEYQSVGGRSIISTTTNGTVAIRACVSAERVLVGAILNLGAMAAELRRLSPDRLLLICAGTQETFALEDAWAAGRLIELLGANDLTDAAQAALGIVRLHPTPLAALRSARNGRALAARNRGAEVEWCAHESRFNIIGILEQDAVRALSARPAAAPPAALVGAPGIRA
jgi:2-phosphosulfolactate phosphatase